MASIREILAAKLAEMHAHAADEKAAKTAGVPAEMLQDYEALLSMYKSGAKPKDIPEAAAALASAAKIAQHRGQKPVVIPGTTDLQWPPPEAFKGPIGYAPYLSRWKQVLDLTFPQAPGGGQQPAQKPAPQGLNAPVKQLDPLAALRDMAAKAAAQAGKRATDKPLAQEVALVEPDRSDDEPEEP